MGVTFLAETSASKKKQKNTDRYATAVPTIYGEGDIDQQRKVAVNTSNRGFNAGESSSPPRPLRPGMLQVWPASLLLCWCTAVESAFRTLTLPKKHPPRALYLVCRYGVLVLSYHGGLVANTERPDAILQPSHGRSTARSSSCATFSPYAALFFTAFALDEISCILLDEETNAVNHHHGSLFLTRQ